jgi:hypothetical protein
MVLSDNERMQQCLLAIQKELITHNDVGMATEKLEKTLAEVEKRIPKEQKLIKEIQRLLLSLASKHPDIYESDEFQDLKILFSLQLPKDPMQQVLDMYGGSVCSNSGRDAIQPASFDGMASVVDETVGQEMQRKAKIQKYNRDEG